MADEHVLMQVDAWFEEMLDILEASLDYLEAEGPWNDEAMEEQRSHLVGRINDALESYYGIDAEELAAQRDTKVDV